METSAHKMDYTEIADGFLTDSVYLTNPIQYLFMVWLKHSELQNVFYCHQLNPKSLSAVLISHISYLLKKHCD